MLRIFSVMLIVGFKKMNEQKDQSCRLIVFYALGLYLGACAFLTIGLSLQFFPQYGGLSGWMISLMLMSVIQPVFSCAGLVALVLLTFRTRLSRTSQKSLGFWLGAVTSSSTLLIMFKMPFHPNELASTNLWSSLLSLVVVWAYLEVKQKRKKPTSPCTVLARDASR